MGDLGQLLGLDVHYVQASDADRFEFGKTACGLDAHRPPAGSIQGYDAKNDLALCTRWERVTCEACIDVAGSVRLRAKASWVDWDEDELKKELEPWPDDRAEAPDTN